MSFGKKVAAGGFALGVGVAGSAYWIADSGEVPSLHALPELPEPIPSNQRQELVICPGDIPEGQTCDEDNALGVLASSTQVEISLEQIPEHTRQAVISAEDRKFYEHDGIDTRRAIGAIVENILSGHFAEGASTIDRQATIIYPPLTTEQKQECGVAVAGSELLNHEVSRQLGEGCLALTMNEYLTKDEILEIYMNNVYFGRGAVGIEAAAQAYFGKSASELSLQESIVLAGVLPAPSEMDVNVTDSNDPEQTDRMQRESDRLVANYYRVIEAMQKTGNLTAEQADELRAQNVNLIPFQPKNLNDLSRADEIGARHYVDMVTSQAAELLGTDKGGLYGYTIYTTLETADQRAMQQAVTGSPLVNQPDTNGAGVSLNKDGAITAMIGGRDYDELQVNLANGEQGRDSGSSNKGYALAYALEQGWTLDRIMTVPPTMTIPGENGSPDWEINSGAGCDRLGRTAPCEMTLEEGIAVSSNMVAAQIAQEFGIEPIADKMRNLGVDIDDEVYPAMVLGSEETTPLGQATGYNNLLLRDGNAVKPFAITLITDGLGNVVYERDQEHGEQVFSTEAAQGTIQALNGVVTYGTAAGAVEAPAGMTVAGKTGTAQDYTDVWFTGTVRNGNGDGLTASFWIGKPEGKIPMDNASSRSTAEIWNAYIHGENVIGSANDGQG